MAITKPYTFVAGTKAKAVEVNTNFDVLYEEAGKLDRDISNIELDIQNINNSKANINGDATQRFYLANPENSYEGVNKNYLEKSIANVKDYISGFIITKDTDNSIIVSAGNCYDSTFTTMIVSTGNITKTNSTQGANLTYYVHIISDNTGMSTDVLISTESIPSARPSGYNLHRLIGYYTTDDSGNIKIITNNVISSLINSGVKTIVETYRNGTSWYRVWSDGWCEQGGIVKGGHTTVTFLKPFSDNGYFMTWQFQDVYAGDNADFNKISVNSKTNTSAIISAWSGRSWTIMWEAKGYTT